MTALLPTPLKELHLELGARMVPFAGWELPVQYPTGPVQEHHAVRQNAGVFDISHMGRLQLKGDDAGELLQRVMTRDMKRVRPGRAAYGFLTYADGTVVDDVIAVNRRESWLLVANGTNREKVLSWLSAHGRGLSVDIADVTLETVMLAVQGPLANEKLSRMLGVNLGDVRRFGALECDWGAIPILATRTGYTGEDGFEIICHSDAGRKIFREILASGMQACGLASRDSLRLECGYPLYGQEISARITPLEAGMDWAVSFRKGQFIGRDALLKQRLEGLSRVLTGFRMLEGGVPRTGYSVFRRETCIGYVTSGNKSPTLNQFIGMALCDTSLESSEEIEIEIRGRLRKAAAVSLPFVHGSP